MDTAYSDLSGIFYVQQQYLLDLSALSNHTGVGGSDTLGYMQDLRNQLNQSYSKYQGASPSATAVLTNQSSISSIINNEVQRLSDKQQSVDTALFGQKRMASFSDSYSKKYFAQIKILFVLIVVIIIYLGLIFLNSIVPVPDQIFTFVMVVVGAFAFYIILVTL